MTQDTKEKYTAIFLRDDGVSVTHCFEITGGERSALLYLHKEHPDLTLLKLIKREEG